MQKKLMLMQFLTEKMFLLLEFWNILKKLVSILEILPVLSHLKLFLKIIIEEIKRLTNIIAIKLKIIGFLNIQFAIKDEKIFVLEVNPRASRTVPFISKAIGIPLANIATQIMLGKKLSQFKLSFNTKSNVFVKESVFPFDRFPGEDVILGPEMKSTGEVMGIDQKFPLAFLKSQIAAGNNLPLSGSVFISSKRRG